MSEQISDFYKSLFEKFTETLNGQRETEILRIRKNALDSFLQNGFPTTKNEEWKYTDLSTLNKKRFELALQKESAINKDKIQSLCYKDMKCEKIVFVNGAFRGDLSDTKSTNVKSIREKIEKDPQIINKYLTQEEPESSEPFRFLSTAFFTDGAFIEIPENTVIENPVSLVFLTTKDSNSALHTPRNIIYAGENSQFTLIESYLSLDATAYITNAVTEIEMEQNAIVDHYKIQNEPMDAFHFSHLSLKQSRDSNLHSTNIAFGGKLSRNTISAELNDEGIECTLNGLYIGEDNQHIDNRTTIDHKMPNCQSNELYKGILNNKAHGVFNGKIFVRQDAQKTNAIQNNSGLLLSDEAMLDTKPQLEIFADDVKCTHGATIGQINNEALFYMRSRGISEQKARSLLIFAFASDVVDQIRNDSLREAIGDMLSDKLHTIKPALKSD